MRYLIGKKSKVKLFYSAPKSWPESWPTWSAALRKFPPYCNVHHICLYLVSIHQRVTQLLNSATLLA